MTFLSDLWLPIIVSAFIVFIGSAILWMATPLHKKDFTAPPDEAGITGALRSHPFAPGQYMIPWCSGGNMKDPAYLARVREGPWALLIIPSGAPSFGRSLLLWFVNCLVISFFVAYAARAALPQGAPYLTVFRVVGAVALLGYAGGMAQDSIWRGLPWPHAVTKLIDGLVYSLLTAGVFGWLWPRGIGA